MRKKTTLLEPVKYQSFSHWFSYHWWIIPIALFVLLIAYLIWSGNASTAKIDFYVGFVSSSPLTEEEEDALLEALTRCGTDVNGDGEVCPEVIQYIIDYDMDEHDSNAETNYAYVMKLAEEMQVNTCYLYLMDNPEGVQRTTGALRYTDGTVAGEEDNYESASWQEMVVSYEFAGRTCWLGRRALYGEEPDYESAFPGGEALYQALLAAQ